MSRPIRRGVGLAAALFLAAIAQSVYADAMQVRGARPDFLTATALIGALFCDANGGAALGFFAGLLHGALAAPPQGGFGSLIVSATLVGMLVGWLEERLFRDSAWIAVPVAAGGTILAECLFFLFAPQHHILHWARSVGLTTLYNTLLSLPLYFLIRLLMGEMGEGVRVRKF